MLTLPLRIVQTLTARNMWRPHVCLDLLCHDSKRGVAMEEKEEEKELFVKAVPVRGAITESRCVKMIS